VPRDYLQDAACDLPFKIAAPWISYLRFYVDFAGVGDVGGQPHTRKSRLREFSLSLGTFNFRMQALRPLQLSKQFRCSATRWYVLPVSYSYAGRACATSAI
jgi:hypothetical protein